MIDYKAKCEELTVAYLETQRENERLRRDNRWIRNVLAQALEKTSAIVVREEELAHAPEIEIAENMANELIIRVRRTRK